MKSFHFHVKFSYYFEGLYNALHSTVNRDHGVYMPDMSAKQQTTRSIYDTTKVEEHVSEL